ncbi:Conserved_hypothetical protein [Hexamita inflata]|uniref:Uncharacterized protein n=1 Tax=Hexamita inflata TaxID=28002 RepID=A0AA86RFB3_9EUKA|nr:Conserved hypothetical protein [Hexamita inflata]
MSLLQTLEPTIKEINNRHESLNKFIEKAQLQLPSLREKLQPQYAAQIDYQKIGSVVDLIASHVKKNIEETDELQTLVQTFINSIQEQPESDAIQKTAQTALEMLNQVFMDGSVIKEELLALQDMISTIQRIIQNGIQKNKSEQKPVEQKQEPVVEAKQDSAQARIKFSQIQEETKHEPTKIQILDELSKTQKPIEQKPIQNNTQVQKQTVAPKRQEPEKVTVKPETDREVVDRKFYESEKRQLQETINQQTAINKQVMEQQQQQTNQINQLKNELFKAKSELEVETVQNATFQQQINEIILETEKIQIEFQNEKNNSDLKIKSLLAENSSLKKQIAELKAQEPQVYLQTQPKQQANKNQMYQSVNTDNELSNPEDAKIVHTPVFLKKRHSDSLVQQELEEIREEKREMQKLINSLKQVLLKVSINDNFKINDRREPNDEW